MSLKKYLISIEDNDSERLKKFYQQQIFNTYRSEFIKFGVKGKNLSTSEYYQLAVAKQDVPLSPGELGCTLSHIKALQDFLMTEEKYALVLEDDLIQVVNIDLNDIENQINNLNLEECFFFSLCGIQLQVNNKIRGQLLQNKIYEKAILKLHPYYVAQFCYTCAYVVDRSMAKLLLEYHKVPHICDHWDELHKLGKKYHFYATFLFDHPEINQVNTIHSFIETERIQRLNRTNRSFRVKFKNSIQKKWLKIFNTTYPKNG